MASLGAGATGTFDLAVLVEDAWQRRGIGTRLTAAVLNLARATGVSSVHADVLGDNRFILQALRRIGPLTVTIDSGNLLIGTSTSAPMGTTRQGGSTPPTPRGNRMKAIRAATSGDDAFPIRSLKLARDRRRRQISDIRLKVSYTYTK